MTTFGKAAIALTLAVLTVIAVPAFAGKGGKGNGRGTNGAAAGSSIVLGRLE